LTGPLKDSLYLTAIEPAGSRTPPFTEEELFNLGLERLLEWGARHVVFHPNTEQQFVNFFFEGFSRKPHLVVYAPIFRLHRPNSSGMMTPIVLDPLVSVCELSLVERDFVRYEARLYGSTSGFPLGFADTLPSLWLKIEHSIDLQTKKAKADANQSMEDFKTLLTGLFNTDVDVPFFFSGVKYPWHPWVYVTGQFSKEFSYDGGFKSFSDTDLKLVEKYWKELSEFLGGYNIAASRLKSANKRENLLERAVDLAIALESLYDFNDELSFRYSLITANIVKLDPQSRLTMFNKLKKFYDFRSKIVHGNGIETKWAKLNREEAKAELAEVEKAIRDFLKIQLLNPHLRTNEGQIENILGISGTIVREMVHD
jgi:hypothetical protein